MYSVIVIEDEDWVMRLKEQHNMGKLRLSPDGHT